MAENAGGDNAAVAEVPPPLTLPEEVTKATVRKTVWDYIMKHRLANFPLPVYQRIPNVKGAEEASKKLAETTVFKDASTIKSNPDKPQEAARRLALEQNKTLLVPTPRLRTTLFTKLTPPEEADEATVQKCATSQGIREHSKRIEIEESVKIDLVLLGSVAVSSEGYRIGKGDGFFDLEYAMMRSVGAINEDTPVVTTVQDFQVIDLPESIFSEHDIRVDYVVTPTQVIQCGKHTQPRDIKWSLLTEDRLNRIPVLKKLRLFEFKAGKDVSLKDQPDDAAPTLEKLQEDVDNINDDEDAEPQNYYRRRRRYRNNYSYRRRRRPNSEGGEGGEGSQGEEGSSPSRGGEKDGRVKRRFGRRRFSRRRRRTNSQKENDETGGSEGERAEGAEGEDGEKKQVRRRRPYRKPNNRRGNSQTEGGSDSAGDGEPRSDGGSGAGGRPPRRYPRNRTYSIFVGKLPPSLRVSHFKKEVRDKEVNPIQVVWHGNNGHAFLVFMGEDEAQSAIERLNDFEITMPNDKGTRKLRVEIANSSRTGGGGKPRGESGDGGDEATGDDN